MPRETRYATPPAASFGHAATDSRASENEVFRKDGEFWKIAYHNRAFRLTGTKGFVYLAHLR
jgi:hypothetical protein